ncbi:hypothetical protein SAMN02927924_01679 [Sphingobium faniae]|nr:hypothetical protein SAMN02927924_01679 [Sphingobium faniae]
MTPKAASSLPGVLAEIADVAGEDAALAIASARGGTQIYVPPVPDADHWISKLVGVEAARAIADRLTCGIGIALRLDLPLGPAGHAARQRAQVDAMIAENRSERDIALATGYTIRTIRRRRAKLGKPEDDRQLTFL